MQPRRTSTSSSSTWPLARKSGAAHGSPPSHRRPTWKRSRPSLRETFLRLLDGFPRKPAFRRSRRPGTIEADDYVVEKLVYESFPGYFVPALLYRPRTIAAPLPGVLSPCGHSTNGKAAGAYQILHINLAKRGYVVLTYDPVGQGERSQFWDAKKAARAST